ncbi:MAG: transcriptional regulator [Thaumarchaeota archaeon]|nr:transcriptional regulator [Nitrososphaerota archaeon]
MDSNGRRSKLEIFVDILDCVGKGIEGPTRIMYRANLSWIVLQNALDTLMANGFLVEKGESKRRAYHLTEKGLQVLNHFKHVKNELLVNPTLNSNQSR